jgi:dGTPase
MTIAHSKDPAPYAVSSTRGRRHAEPESATRGPFQRDRDRIIHSAAFRKMEYKTQVFVYHEGDYYRTRLTHSLEVAQIARSMCRVLRLNEDLAEALALAHDLGHTPFGHAGEDALHAAIEDHGGFDHNAQTLRILTRLEHRYAEFDGLNLTWETLEGVVKHNGPLVGPGKKPLPMAIDIYNAEHDLELATFAGAEAQVTSLADDIAYNNHDLDDGLRAGLFDLDDIRHLKLVAPAYEDVEKHYPGLERSRFIHEVIRRMIGSMVDDLLAETRRRLDALAPRTADDIRHADAPVAAFSDTLMDANLELKTFLYRNMYRHYRVNRMTSKAKRVVTELYNLYWNEPEILPTEWRNQTDGPGTAKTARLAADFIAGMTDRYALLEHSRLFDLTGNQTR